MMNGDVAWLELKRKQADANIILKEYAHSCAEADSKLEKKLLPDDSNSMCRNDLPMKE